MASLNRVILIGNLTRTPELRYTPSGTPVANFGVAVNRRWTNRQGERQEGVDYFNIVAWGKLAELCGEYIDKGSPVALEGRLQSRSWEAQDGSKRNTVEIVAETVQFLGAPKGGGADRSGGSDAAGGDWSASNEPWGEMPDAAPQASPQNQTVTPESVLEENLQVDEEIPF